MGGLQVGEVSSIPSCVDIVDEVRAWRDGDGDFLASELGAECPEFLEDAECGGARFSDGKNPEACGVVVEKGTGFIGDIYDELGTSVEEKQVVRRAGGFLERHALEFRFG